MKVKTANDNHPDYNIAAENICREIEQPNIKIVLIFASSRYDSRRLIAAVSSCFEDVLIAGCTTAGEIGDNGFFREGVTAASIAGDDIDVAAEVITDLAEFSTENARNAVDKCCRRLNAIPEKLNPEQHFGMIMIDGLSAKEETVTAAIALSAPRIKIVGGSASDDWKLKKTYVFLNNQAYENSAIFLLFDSRIPFRVFNRHHFKPTENEMVITKASIGKRIIKEIDGIPAVKRYTELLGVKPGQLELRQTAQNPFGFEIEGYYYIRSIIGLDRDYLIMASAVNEGTVLTLMKPGDILRDTMELGSTLKTELGNVGFLILFNCLGRYEETVAKQLSGDVFDALNISPLLGFNTYGEQFCSLHMNHSITGVAFKA